MGCLDRRNHFAHPPPTTRSPFGAICREEQQLSILSRQPPPQAVQGFVLFLRRFAFIGIAVLCLVAAERVIEQIRRLFSHGSFYGVLQQLGYVEEDLEVVGRPLMSSGTTRRPLPP